MIPVVRLLYGIDLKLNKLASTVNQSIPIENKIIALNEAQLRLIKKKVNVNNLYQIGFDGFMSRYEDLQNLVVPYEIVIPTKTSETLPSYSFSVEDLKNKYYLPVDIIVKATKGECKNHSLFVPRLTKHGDLTTRVNNPHYKPSFAYQETLAVMSSNKLIVYSDDFTIDSVHFSYLRYPKKIDIEGYIDFDGEESVNQNCELPEYLEDELLELTVMELGLSTENPAGQTALQKSQNSE